ncbi:transposase [Clostridium tagluense]|uniref:transposase n=1 Tax=Clostridium tagluense TaxID=360422 RepID=UPI001C0AFBC1|nr:transposase [Clostridium tagluense]MBU3128735.1 transposase [Clostridium tagluense]
MFCKNNVQQTTFLDPVAQMPKYLQNILKNCWAQSFRDYVFPQINEERFSIIYSSDHASRPNTPINIIIALLIIKEIFQQTDEELIGSLHFDIRYQYALYTTAYEKQPVSINTLTNFRNRVIEYEKSSGIDLIKLEVEALASAAAKYLCIDNKKIRVDSLMVSSSCKKLSRIELVYSVNYRLIKDLNEYNKSLISEECLTYLEKGNKNETIYRTQDLEAISKLLTLLRHSEMLRQACSKLGTIITNSESYQLLVRMLEDQTTIDENNKLTPKDGKGIASTSLQNPTDPDATFRHKYAGNIGYVANIVETFNDDTSIITDYDLKANIYSDSKFSDDVIKAISEKKEADEKIQMITDGAYYEQEKAEGALKQNIELIPRELVGRKPSTNKMGYDKFAVDKEKNVIISCPNGTEPEESYYKSKSYTAKFSKDTCEKCPHKNKCPIKTQKKFNTISVSEKRRNTDLQREKMSQSEYIEIINQRAGVEGIPSVLRRRYKIDNMPIRGLLRSKLWLGFKIVAYNFKKMLVNLLKNTAGALFKFFIATFLLFYNIFKYSTLKFEIAQYPNG